MKRLEVSGAVRPIYGSLGAKRLNTERWTKTKDCSKCHIKSSNPL